MISIPCVYAQNYDSTPWTDGRFPTQQYKMKLQHLPETKQQINIHDVTLNNKQFMPPFRDVGFAFEDVSKYIRNMKNYNKMIRRLYNVAVKLLPSTAIEPNYNHLKAKEKRILFNICRDFAESNGKKMSSSIHSVYFLKTEGDGRPFHFDAETGIDHSNADGTTSMGAWIPLSNIDNFPLVVGDARSYFEDDGVCKGLFDDAFWYKQENMTPTDAIFWNLKTVPHGSINLGDGRKMKKRYALSFQFAAVDTCFLK